MEALQAISRFAQKVTPPPASAGFVFYAAKGYNH